MATRTTVATVNFSYPFTIPGIDDELPAGSYEVETDEELLEGVSFRAYRRTLTVLHVQGKGGQPIMSRSISVDPKELEMAIERDRAATSRSADPSLDVSGVSPALGSTGDSGATKEMEQYGISRHTVDYFHYRSFRYTSLADAVSQAKRDQPSR